MYPEHIAKYYDLYSGDGNFKYVLELLWYELSSILGIFLLGIPLDVWIAIFEGQSWDDMWNWLLYIIPFGNWIVELFDIKVQDGWRMM